MWGSADTVGAHQTSHSVTDIQRTCREASRSQMFWSVLLSDRTSFCGTAERAEHQTLAQAPSHPPGNYFIREEFGNAWPPAGWNGTGRGGGHVHVCGRIAAKVTSVNVGKSSGCNEKPSSSWMRLVDHDCHRLSIRHLPTPSARSHHKCALLLVKLPVKKKMREWRRGALPVFSTRGPCLGLQNWVTTPKPLLLNPLPLNLSSFNTWSSQTGQD